MNNEQTRVLVIDDEPQIRKLLRITLKAHQYDVSEAENGKLGIQKLTIFKPDIILLDLTLPDIFGNDVIKAIREWSKTPIIVLSVRGSEKDKVSALDSGADDYLTKPFSIGELLARIRSALRHFTKTQDEPILLFNGISMDLSKRQVIVDDREIKLTPTEYEILKILLMNSEKVITQKQLLQAVWGPSYTDDFHYLRVYMRQLRLKIELEPSQPKHLITEPGIGYRII
jgi:two-component system, OmpR family, KDP operon response regulator KdpE